ncbi:hypothetical protein [Hoeflea poritis]|uniref:Uncharacterized protein n=1 Tax=Hoeflea poritis TaxID=2993659 RepID=A0ABT4VPG1_9HYPH|nr:hypothetical protein [Hoeflea poritis]MDA4845962.1 hypothetical protein [Hoeflea poritis]
MVTDWNYAQNEILTGDDEYASDLDYLDAMTEKFGCHMMRDNCACKAAGHTDISKFDPFELAYFKKIYSVFITQFILSSECTTYAGSNKTS